jgi:hypothetical protein
MQDMPVSMANYGDNVINIHRIIKRRKAQQLNWPKYG